MIKSLLNDLLAFAFLIFSTTAFGQVHKVINYECLETPLVLLNANHDNTVTYCTEGLVQVDTLEEDCYEFYEEDQNVFRGWFYNELDSEGNIQYDFGRITFHEDDEWQGEAYKYFELERAGFWVTLPSLENPQARFALKLKDLSGAGINMGFSFEDGPIYFPTLQDVVATDFTAVTVAYAEETLIVDGSVRNVYIGGDHIYFGQMELGQILTSVTKVEEESVRFFPNPTADLVRIESELLLDAQVKVFSAPGVLHATASATGSQIDLDVSGLPAGVFWVQIWKNGELLRVKPLTKF